MNLKTPATGTTVACVVPHFRQTGQWTSAVNVNFAAAMEYALNEGKSPP